jgi:hypothetical protein
MGNKILVSCCLDGFAAVAAAGEKMERSALLAGAADNLRDAIGYKIELTESFFRDAYLTRVRAVLSEETANEHYERGKAMDPDDAISLAIGG